VSGPDPVVDARRSAELHAELEARARRWIPGWNAGGSQGDFGTALLHIAAHFAAEVTQRLDRVPAKTAYDLLDWLRITGRPGHAARIPVVFRMAASSSDCVDVPAWVRLQADAGGQAVTFETTHPLRLVPAPIAHLVAVDPASDALRYPPPSVLSLSAPPTGPQVWRVQSMAPAAATQLQLTPDLGLEPGAIVQADGEQYRIVSRPDGGLTTISPALGAGGLARDARVEAVHVFQPYHGNARDMQEHGLYIGDDDMLNLTAPAAIGLGGPAAAALLGAGLKWEYWGSIGEHAPAWQALVLARNASDAPILQKADKGTVVPLAIGGRTSRWIRATPRPGDVPSVQFERLTVEINPHVTPPTDGSPVLPEVAVGDMPALEGVANNMSVPLQPDPFYPLGKVPRQFDAFYLSCPEVFSKPKANAILALKMAEPTLGPLVALPVPNNEAYCVLAVATDGALHRHTWSGGTERNWQVIGPVRPSPDLLTKAPLFRQADHARAPVVSLVAGQMQAMVWSENQVWVWQETLTVPAATGSWHYFGMAGESGKVVISQAILLGSGGTGPVCVVLAKAENAGDGELFTAPFQKDAPFAVLEAENSWSAIAAIIRVAPDSPHATLGETFFAMTGDGAIVQCSRTSPTHWTFRTFAEHRLAPGHVPVAAHVDRTTWLIGKSATGSEDGDVLAILGITDGVVNAVHRVSVGGHLVGDTFSLDVVANATVAQDASFRMLLAFRPVGKPAQVGWWRPEEPTVLVPSNGPQKTDQVLEHGPVAAGADLLMPGTQRDVQIANFASLQPPTFRLGAGNISNCVLSTAAYDPGDLVELTGDTLIAIGQPVHSSATSTAYALSATTLASQVRIFPLAGQPRFPARHEARSASLLQLDPGFPAALDVDSILVIFYTVGAATAQCVRTVTEAPVETASGHTIKIKPALPLSARNQTLTFTLYASPGFPDPADCMVHPMLSLDGAFIGGRPVIEALRETTSIEFVDGGAKPPRQAIVALSAPGTPALAILGQAWESPPSPGVRQLRIARGDGAWSRYVNDVTSNPDLSWEYWNGVGWWKIEQLHDETMNLKRSGRIWFDVPNDLAPTEVLGRSSHWIRARLVGGDYGRESFVVETRAAAGNTQLQTVKVNTDSVHAPLIMRITIQYGIPAATLPKYVLTRDNGAWRDQSDANRSTGASVQAFVRVGDMLKPMSGRASGPALYLALRKAFSGSPIRILFVADDTGLDLHAPLDVEALRDGRFEPVTAVDDTRALGETGMLSLSLDTSPTESELFGETGFWLRIMPRGDNAAGLWKPSLRGVYVNALWAEATQTQEMEILGSSDGSPDQRHLLSHFPLLADSLELRVREPLGEEEARQLLRTQAGAVKSTVDAYPGHWVRWTEVADPGDEDASARVYALDFARGEIRFGDGVHGAVPPVGRDAVMAFRYRHGGAAAANHVTDFAPMNLSTPIQGVEAVFAPQCAAGGADPESADTVRRFAATRLRSRGRAVTLCDLEQLVLGGSAQVAQARALHGPDGVQLVLVARAADPQPGQALGREIRNRITGQAGPASVRRLRIPVRLDLLPFQIAINLYVDDLDVHGALGVLARQAVAELFDHVSGGADGQGWPIGRTPTETDVASRLVLLEGLAGIGAIVLTTEDGRPMSAIVVRPGQLARLAPDGITLTLTTPEAASWTR
jgi:hypothetical protein